MPQPMETHPGFQVAFPCGGRIDMPLQLENLGCLCRDPRLPRRLCRGGKDVTMKRRQCVRRHRPKPRAVHREIEPCNAHLLGLVRRVRVPAFLKQIGLLDREPFFLLRQLGVQGAQLLNVLFQLGVLLPLRFQLACHCLPAR